MPVADTIAVAITGASGAPYGVRLVELLLQAGVPVELVLSDTAVQVLRQECNLDWGGQPAERVRGHYQVGADRLRVYHNRDWLAPLASGSGGPRAMVVCPCSMGNLAAIATGRAENLIQRGADVMLKEGRPLVLVPRETPYNAIHLQNMLQVQRAGAIILPASPGFYHRPQQVADLVDFVAARILDRLGVAQGLAPAWPQDADVR